MPQPPPEQLTTTMKDAYTQYFDAAIKVPSDDTSKTFERFDMGAIQSLILFNLQKKIACETADLAKREKKEEEIVYLIWELTNLMHIYCKQYFGSFICFSTDILSKVMPSETTNISKSRYQKAYTAYDELYKPRGVGDGDLEV